MKVTKAVITAAGPDQRNLPLQTLIDRDGNRKTVLQILVEEVLEAGVEEIAVVLHPDDVTAYREACTPFLSQISFITQNTPSGYGQAMLCAAEFVGNDFFLHLVGDHLYVSRSQMRCAKHLIAIAELNNCSVSAVQPTREALIPHFGVIGASRIHGSNELYKVEKVIEKPTPTVAEQQLFVSGLRAGHYLCFFGMHVLSPTIMKILAQLQTENPTKKLDLSSSLNELTVKEHYLALEISDWRFDMGAKYGLLKAQLSLALAGKDRDRLMAELLEFFVTKDIHSIGR
jgi:UTP--glucose-1-phosphate uridylyltransferase